MVTRSASSSSARSKHSAASSKKAKRPVRRAAQVRAKSSGAGAKKAQGKGKVAGAGDWAARDKRFVQLFGPTTPKGKVLDASGAALTPLAAARAGLCVMPFAPRHDRMNWIYLTHGMPAGGKHKIELALHWKPREAHQPAVALHRMAQYSMTGGVAIGDVISGNEGLDLSSSGFQHWLVCAPDGSLPEQIDLPGVKPKLLLLIGISDAEMQTAMKVKPEIADGRRVLLEALKAGGIFPVTDPGRTSLTRRRDFHRLWETAFHAVKEV